MSFRGGGGGGFRGGARGGGQSGGRKPFVVTTKLYIGNIPETCRRLELQKLFESHGTVVECDIVKNYGFVHYKNPEEAENAQKELDGREFEGVPLKVELSHSRVRHKPGMGGKQECYRCGKEGHWSKDCPKGPSRPKTFGERRDPYGPPLPSRDPYDDYYRDRYPPPPPIDRYRPYADPYDRRPAPRDPYYRERDPYARPPPDYYRSSRPAPPEDPYYDEYYRRSYLPPPPRASRMSPPQTRVAPY